MCPGEDTLLPGGVALFVHLEVGYNCSSSKRRASGPRIAVAISFVLFWISAASAGAQIASYVDGSGKRVFINAAPAAPKKTARQAPKPVPGKETTHAPSGASPTAKMSATPPKEHLDRMVSDAAERHRVDPNLVRAVIQAESNWNPFAISRKGAFGLMQLVPGTAAQLGVYNVFDPEQNLDGGVRYLRTLLERYNGDLPRALAAYNAGQGTVDRWGGVPNFRETRLYVQKVTNSYFRPGSGDSRMGGFPPRQIRRMVDERGRVIFTNE